MTNDYNLKDDYLKIIFRALPTVGAVASIGPFEGVSHDSHLFTVKKQPIRPSP